MARSSDAKKNFIATAVDLFRRRGYHGVGLNEIIETSGAPKGSFYHHFPEGKEQLAEAAVKAAGQSIGRLIDEAFGEAPSFEAGVEALAEMIGAWFEESGWQDACPITAIVVDAVPGSARLSAAVAEVAEDWIARAQTHAARLDAPYGREHAQRFFIALEGAWIVARIQRSREPFRIAARMAL